MSTSRMRSIALTVFAVLYLIGVGDVRAAELPETYPPQVQSLSIDELFTILRRGEMVYSQKPVTDYLVKRGPSDKRLLSAWETYRDEDDVSSLFGSALIRTLVLRAERNPDLENQLIEKHWEDLVYLEPAWLAERVRRYPVISEGMRRLFNEDEASLFDFVFVPRIPLEAKVTLLPILERMEKEEDDEDKRDQIKGLRAAIEIERKLHRQDHEVGLKDLLAATEGRLWPFAHAFKALVPLPQEQFQQVFPPLQTWKAIMRMRETAVSFESWRLGVLQGIVFSCIEGPPYDKDFNGFRLLRHLIENARVITDVPEAEHKQQVRVVLHKLM